MAIKAILFESIPLNCIPHYLTFARVNRLTVPGETVESIIMDIEELGASLKVEAEVTVKTKPPLYSYYVMDRTEPLVELFDSVYRKVRGVEPYYGYNSSITDARASQVLVDRVVSSQATLWLRPLSRKVSR